MKSNTDKLRKEIVSLISTTGSTALSSRVYYLNFPKPATYPYVVYDLRETQTLDGRTSFTLELDCVDHAAVPKTVNALADAIQDALDHCVVNTTDLFFHCYRSRRYPVTEDDKEIRRIHLQMELYYYTKEE